MIKKYEVIKEIKWCDIVYQEKDLIELDSKTADFIAKEGFIKNERISKKDIEIFELINELLAMHGIDRLLSNFLELLSKRYEKEGLSINIMTEGYNDLISNFYELLAIKYEEGGLSINSIRKEYSRLVASSYELLAKGYAIKGLSIDSIVEKIMLQVEEDLK